MWLSEAKTWISDAICCDLFCVQWFEVGGYCMFCCYWWNCWPSTVITEGPSWSWSYWSWIYNYLCNQCLSSLTLWVRISLRRGALDTALCDKVYPWLVAGRWFSSVSPTNKTHNHDITEILLKVALNTITLTLYVFRLWTVFKGDRIVLYNMCCCVFPLHCMLILCCFINI